MENHFGNKRNLPFDDVKKGCDCGNPECKSEEIRTQMKTVADGIASVISEGIMRSVGVQMLASKLDVKQASIVVRRGSTAYNDVVAKLKGKKKSTPGKVEGVEGELLIACPDELVDGLPDEPFVMASSIKATDWVFKNNPGVVVTAWASTRSEPGVMKMRPTDFREIDAENLNQSAL